jgi:hypothetical protein
MPEPEPNVSPNLSRKSAGNRPTPTSPLLTKARLPMVTESAPSVAEAGASTAAKSTAEPTLRIARENP